MADLTDIDNVAPADSLYQGSIKINAIRARLDELYTVLSDITAVEATQVENMGSVTVSNTQWGYLGALDQALATTDSPTFAGLTLTGGFTLGGILTLAGDVVCDDYAFTGVGDMTFTAGSILASGSTNTDTLLLKANDTTCITLTTAATDTMDLASVNSLTAIANIDIGAYDLRAATLTADGLTATRVVFAGANGLLSDDADFTFDTATLTVTNIAAFNLTGKLTAGATEIEGSAFDINGGNMTGVTVSGDLTWSVAQTGLTLTSPTINGTVATTGLTLPAITLAGAVAGGDQAFTGVGDFTFTNGSIITASATDTHTLLIKAGGLAGTSVITITSLDAGDTLGLANVNSLVAVGNLDIGAYDLRALSFTADSLTSGRVPFASTDGLLIDDADFTFATDTLTVTKIGAFQAAGAINFDSQNMTNVDIDSGTIDGISALTSSGDLDIGAHDFRAATLTADGLTTGRVVFTTTNGQLVDNANFTLATNTLTVGASGTLDVSAGTFTLADNQVSGDKVEGGTVATITITALTTAGITPSANIDFGAYDLAVTDLSVGTDALIHDNLSVMEETYAKSFTTSAHLSLDGSGYITIADATQVGLDMGLSDFMFGIWIKTSSTAIFPIIYKSGTGGYYDLHLNATTGYLECIINDGTNTATITGDIALNDGKWHLVRPTIDKSSVTGGRLYVDGSEDTSARTDVTSVLNIDNDGAFYVGYNGTNYATGEFDEFEPWNFGYGGLPADVAAYDTWRYANPYAALSDYDSDAWAGYADADRTEKVTDGGIESWTGDTPDDWNESGESAGVRDIVNEGVEIHEGANAAKLEATANDGTTDFEINQNITLVVGEYYEFQRWIYFASRTQGSALTRIYGGGDLGYRNQATTDAAYTFNGDVFTPTLTANLLQLRYLNETTGIVYFDDISVKRVGLVAHYKFDGDYTDETTNSNDLTAGGSGNSFVGGTANIYGKLTISKTAAAISGEEHLLSVAYTGACSSGDSMVGGNFAVTPTGTAATWVSGIYAKVTQGATKAVNGYISGAEFEVINSADNVSDWFPLVLNVNNSGAQQGSHSSYVALRTYGSLEPVSMFWFPSEHSVGTKSDTALLTTAVHLAGTHAIRFIVDSTPYWVVCSNVAPSGT